MKDTLPARARLGAFEVNLQIGELRQGERAILLQEQPFLVLRMLIERDGKIVTREEIKKKFWPNDTVVEFDHSINAAIMKLRRALDEAADGPKYIQTLPRRGYRLLMPVEWIVDADYFVSETSAPVAASAGVLGPPDLGGLTGRTVSHYRVLDIIGGGGMGVVYRAEDLKLGRQVALKFLPEELGSDPRALERFDREARTVSSLDHPNICTIHEFGEHEGRAFMVMQLLKGQTLRDRLAASDGPLALDELLDIGIHIGDGLRAAHERGIVHRDIKPANIFITDKGICKILDFGLAKLLERGDEDQVAVRLSTPPAASPAGSGTSHITRTGSAMGTAGYMSPEQVRGEQLDARTDLFSFGLVVYEMAAGRRAFSGETAEVVHEAILNHPVVSVRELNPVLPRKLVATIDKALEKDRGLRYQSAAEMCADLEQVRSGNENPAGRLWIRIAAIALLATLTTASGLYWRSRNNIKLTDNDTIVLADFTNTTTDPVFDDALNAALRVELEQTPYLNLLALDKVRGTLKETGHPETEKLTPQLARDVCVHTNSKAYVAGSIADHGNHYEIELRGVDCQTGKTFAKTAMEVKNREQVVKILGVAGSDLRGEMGEPQASLRKFDQPLDQATTSSLEALQSFAQSRIIQREKGDAESLPYLQRAVELDPNFAVAYCSLGDANYNLDARGRATENYKRAFALRDRGSARQRFYVEGSYYALVTGELEETIPIYRKWIQTYPGETAAHNNLSRNFRVLGQYEMAIVEAKESLRIRPKSYVPVDNLMWAYVAINRQDQAKSAFDEALSRGVDVLDLRSMRYLIAFLEGDEAAMREQVAWASGQPGTGQEFLFLQSDEAAYHGRFRHARELANHAIKMSVDGEHLDGWKGFIALGEAEVGNFGRAREVGEALESMPERDVRLEAAMVLARSGEISEAQKLVDDLQQQFPRDTMMQNYMLPTIRAAIEVQKENPTGAIKMLQVAVPYELGTSPSWLGNLYPAYVRGQAYLDAGMSQQAEAEFQKILDHPGIVLDDVTGALAHLQLGRAQAMMGDDVAARKSYKDFLTLWKDADPDIPVYKQAKLEYAKLH